MLGEAEAQFRKTQQGLQAHLDAVEKQLRTLRSGGADGDAASGAASGATGDAGSAKPDAVITPAQRAAIDAASEDVLQTRKKLRLVQLELNRDISQLETEMRIFTIVLVPALMTVVAIGMGVVQRRRRARARA
jgi:hypothetical protein